MLRSGVTVPLWSVALILVVLFMQGSLSPLRTLTTSSSSSDEAGRHLSSSIPLSVESSASAHHLRDESNIPIPRRRDGSEMSLEERVRYLELKSNSHMNFGAADPMFGSALDGGSDAVVCKKVSKLDEFGCKEGWEVKGSRLPDCPGLYDHRICLDDLPSPREWDFRTDRPKGDGEKEDEGVNAAAEKDPPCLVYDFGVREQPQFGAVMARTFGCEVHAFDPSPVSVGWWKSDDAKKLRNLPNYHFHPYGAGGIDGDLSLMEYDWGQVSIIRFPRHVVDCGDTLEGSAPCDLKGDTQKSFTLPVKTLPTIVRELGHSNRIIDVLKVDVEGSEYAFLENALDAWGGSLPNVNQLTLEWHHMPWDPRYGEGSSPPINAIVSVLHASGLRQFWRHSAGGWPSNVRAYQRLGMKDVRYNVVSFMRKKKS